MGGVTIIGNGVREVNRRFEIIESRLLHQGENLKPSSLNLKMAKARLDLRMLACLTTESYILTRF